MLSPEVQKGGKGFDDLGENTTHVNPVTEKEEDKRVREHITLPRDYVVGPFLYYELNLCRCCLALGFSQSRDEWHCSDHCGAHIYGRMIRIVTHESRRAGCKKICPECATMTIFRRLSYADSYSIEIPGSHQGHGDETCD